jgi:hypothetical protein
LNFDKLVEGEVIEEEVNILSESDESSDMEYPIYSFPYFQG